MQSLLMKATFDEGIEELITLRKMLMDEILPWKDKLDESDKERISKLNVVSTDEHAVWLIDYWCDKDMAGLLKIPVSIALCLISGISAAIIFGMKKKSLKE